MLEGCQPLQHGSLAGIDVAGPTFHEQEDAGLGLRRKLRRFRRQRIAAAQGWCTLSQKIREGHAAQSGAEAHQKLTSTLVGHGDQYT